MDRQREGKSLSGFLFTRTFVVSLTILQTCLSGEKRKNDLDEGENDWSKWLLGGIAIAGAAAATITVIAALNSSSNEPETSRPVPMESSHYSQRRKVPLAANASPPRQDRIVRTPYHDNVARPAPTANGSLTADNPWLSSHFQAHSSPHSTVSTVTITVDATRTRGGGIIQIANNPTRYFYSVDWSNTFEFPQEADKFEMANALIALDIVENAFSKCHRAILQTDNNFGLKANGMQSKKLHSQLRQMIIAKIGKVCYFSSGTGEEIKQVFKGTCEDLRLADKLSRHRLEDFGMMYDKDYSDYAKKALVNIRPIIPSEYRTQEDATWY